MADHLLLETLAVDVILNPTSLAAYDRGMDDVMLKFEQVAGVFDTMSIHAGKMCAELDAIGQSAFGAAAGLSALRTASDSLSGVGAVGTGLTNLATGVAGLATAAKAIPDVTESLSSIRFMGGVLKEFGEALPNLRENFKSLSGISSVVTNFANKVEDWQTSIGGLTNSISRRIGNFAAKIPVWVEQFGGIQLIGDKVAGLKTGLSGADSGLQAFGNFVGKIEEMGADKLTTTGTAIGLFSSSMIGLGGVTGANLPDLTARVSELAGVAATAKFDNLAAGATHLSQFGTAAGAVNLKGLEQVGTDLTAFTKSINAPGIDLGKLSTFGGQFSNFTTSILHATKAGESLKTFGESIGGLADKFNTLDVDHITGVTNGFKSLAPSINIMDASKLRFAAGDLAMFRDTLVSSAGKLDAFKQITDHLGSFASASNAINSTALGAFPKQLTDMQMVAKSFTLGTATSSIREFNEGLAAGGPDAVAGLRGLTEAGTILPTVQKQLAGTDLAVLERLAPQLNAFKLATMDANFSNLADIGNQLNAFGMSLQGEGIKNLAAAEANLAHISGIMASINKLKAEMAALGAVAPPPPMTVATPATPTGPPPEIMGKGWWHRGVSGSFDIPTPEEIAAFEKAEEVYRKWYQSGGIPSEKPASVKQAEKVRKELAPKVKGQMFTEDITTALRETGAAGTVFSMKIPTELHPQFMGPGTGMSAGQFLTIPGQKLADMAKQLPTHKFAPKAEDFGSIFEHMLPDTTNIKNVQSAISGLDLSGLDSIVRQLDSFGVAMTGGGVKNLAELGKQLSAINLDKLPVIGGHISGFHKALEGTDFSKLAETGVQLNTFGGKLSNAGAKTLFESVDNFAKLETIGASLRSFSTSIAGTTKVPTIPKVVAPPIPMTEELLISSIDKYVQIAQAAAAGKINPKTGFIQLPPGISVPPPMPEAPKGPKVSAGPTGIDLSNLEKAGEDMAAFGTKIGQVGTQKLFTNAENFAKLPKLGADLSKFSASIASASLGNLEPLQVALAGPGMAIATMDLSGLGAAGKELGAFGRGLFSIPTKDLGSITRNLQSLSGVVIPNLTGLSQLGGEIGSFAKNVTSEITVPELGALSRAVKGLSGFTVPNLDGLSAAGTQLAGFGTSLKPLSGLVIPNLDQWIIAAGSIGSITVPSLAGLSTAGSQLAKFGANLEPLAGQVVPELGALFGASLYITAISGSAATIGDLSMLPEAGKHLAGMGKALIGMGAIPPGTAASISQITQLLPNLAPLAGINLSNLGGMADDLIGFAKKVSSASAHSLTTLNPLPFLNLSVIAQHVSDFSTSMASLNPTALSTGADSLIKFAARIQGSKTLQALMTNTTMSNALPQLGKSMADFGTAIGQANINAGNLNTVANTLNAAAGVGWKIPGGGGAGGGGRGGGLPMGTSQLAGGGPPGQLSRLGVGMMDMSFGAKIFALALIGIGVVSVREFAKFDQAITRSLAMMGQFNTQTRQLVEHTVINLSRLSGVGAAELATAVGALARSGLSLQQSLNILPFVEKFSKVAGMDLQKSVHTLTVIINELGLSASQLPMIGDMLVRATQLSGHGSVEQMGAALERVAATAHQMHIPVEEVMGALTQLSTVGIVGADAGSVLERTLINLQDAAMKHAKEWRQYGVEVFTTGGQFRGLASVMDELGVRMQGMSDIQRRAALEFLGFGGSAREMRGLSALIGQGAMIRGFTAEVANAGGTVDRVNHDIMTSFVEQMKQLWMTIKAVAIDIGGMLAPTFLVLGAVLNWVLGLWLEIPKPIKDALGWLIMIAAASWAVRAAWLALAAGRAVFASIAAVTWLVSIAFGGLSVSAWTAVAPLAILVLKFVLIAAAIIVVVELLARLLGMDSPLASLGTLVSNLFGDHVLGVSGGPGGAGVGGVPSGAAAMDNMFREAMPNFHALATWLNTPIGEHVGMGGSPAESAIGMSRAMPGFAAIGANSVQSAFNNMVNQAQNTLRQTAMQRLGVGPTVAGTPVLQAIQPTPGTSFNFTPTQQANLPGLQQLLQSTQAGQQYLNTMLNAPISSAAMSPPLPPSAGMGPHLPSTAISPAILAQLPPSVQYLHGLATPSVVGPPAPTAAERIANAPPAQIAGFLQAAQGSAASVAQQTQQLFPGHPTTEPLPGLPYLRGLMAEVVAGVQHMPTTAAPGSTVEQLHSLITAMESHETAFNAAVGRLATGEAPLANFGFAQTLATQLPILGNSFRALSISNFAIAGEGGLSRGMGREGPTRMNVHDPALHSQMQQANIHLLQIEGQTRQLNHNTPHVTGSGP